MLQIDAPGPCRKFLSTPLCRVLLVNRTRYDRI